MLRFLYHVGQAVAKQGLGEIAKAIADPTYASVGNLLGKIGAEVLKGYRDDRRQNQLNADILEAAKVAFAEAAEQATAIALQLAPDDPILRGHIERFVTLVPAAVQASLKRAEDPSGTTLPRGFAVEDESDIVKLLPVRFPREHFRPGYAPPFLRGWELVEQIGAGGFGEVWKARSQRANQLVGAVKFGHALSDAELSLLNEGDVLNRLLAAGKHPGIVELQDVWADGDEVPWIRYEFVAGGDLTGLIRKWAALPMAQRVPKVLAAFRELCETVGHFHRLTPSIVHRDLKPSNILVTADGRLKIGDFGIGSVSAKRTLDGERRGTLSRTNTVQAYLRGAHTPLYAPPEQKTDPKHRPAPTDDVHALGVILYQMLMGRLDAAPGARFDRDLAGVPKEVVELIGDCVEGEKSRRPTDGCGVVARLPADTRNPNVPMPVVAKTVKPAELTEGSPVRSRRSVPIIWASFGLVAGILFALALREYGWKPVVYPLMAVLGGCGIGFLFGLLTHIGSWLNTGQSRDLDGGWRETWYSARAGSGVFGMIGVVAGLLIASVPRPDNGGTLVPPHWDIVLYPLAGMVMSGTVGRLYSGRGTLRRV